MLKAETKCDTCVVPGDGLWQVAQPIELNKALPLEIDSGETGCPLSMTPPVGGGARNRMKFANAETSSSTAAFGDEVGFDVSSGYPFPERFRQLGSVN